MMSVCQMTECYQVADKCVVYIDLNSENAAVMINNAWVPIQNQNTSMLEIVNQYKQNQVFEVYAPGVIIKNELYGQKIFPTMVSGAESGAGRNFQN